jgi:hypothetical protein
MKIALALALVVLMAACGESPGSSASGIRGHTIIGPNCPVEPCPSSPSVPVGASFVVRRGDVVVTRVRADSQGRFTVNLEPGEYVLATVDQVPSLKPVAVTVQPGAFTEVVLDFDSGMR